MQRIRQTFVLLVVLLTVACAQRNPNITTPAGERAVRETAAVQRIGELQNLVIGASDAKRMPQPTARVIVQWTVNALELIKSKPTGWVPAALNTWSTIDADLNMPGVQTPRFLVATGPPDIAAFVPIVDELLKGL